MNLMKSDEWKAWKAKSRIPMESWKFCDGFSCRTTGAVPQFASLYVGDLHPDVTEA